MPQLSDLDINKITEEVTNIARDAAYVVVGLGVLGFQKAQVQRVEMKSKFAKDFSIEDRLNDVRAEFGRQAKNIDGIVEGAVQFIESTLEPLEAQLPTVARDLAKKAHEQAREVRTQIRDLVVPAA